MLQYLVILLDDTSVSFCHYSNPIKERRLMPLDILKKGILWAMKENLMIQFVFPDYTLPNKYLDVIETIDHSKIKPVEQYSNADVIVVQSWEDLDKISFKDISVVLRTTKDDLFRNYERIIPVLKGITRLNIVFTDIYKFSEADFDTYSAILERLAGQVKALYINDRTVQLNILTDRMMLDKMNNCNAGWESVTLAPDAKFYVCPAFYLGNDGYAIGDLQKGLDIKNPQLYRIDHAPICKRCDAYQCRRCVWLNRKMTLEINTPSHEQCVISHLERNASQQLLTSIRLAGDFLVGREISTLNYLDPFDNIKE